MGQIVEDRFLRRALLSALEAAPAVEHRAGVGVVGQAIGPGAAVGDARRRDRARRPRSSSAATGGRAASRRVPASAAAAGTTARPRWSARSRTSGRTAASRTSSSCRRGRSPSCRCPATARRSSGPSAADRAAAIGRLDDAGYLAELRPRFGDFLGDIALEGGRYAYPLGLSLAERWTLPRLALAGDAAHGIHPLAGQGLNLGLRDVAALAEVLAEARRRGEDVGAADVLARYAPLATVRHRLARRGDRRAEPAVLERQPGAPPRPRPRARRWSTGCRRCAGG